MGDFHQVLEERLWLLCRIKLTEEGKEQLTILHKIENVI